MRITVVKHGEYDFETDLLTPTGKQQVERTKSSLGTMDLMGVYTFSSSLPSAIETAMILGRNEKRPDDSIAPFSLKTLAIRDDEEAWTLFLMLLDALSDGRKCEHCIIVTDKDIASALIEHFGDHFGSSVDRDLQYGEAVTVDLKE